MFIPVTNQSAGFQWELKPLEQHNFIVAVTYNDATWMVLLENAGAYSPEQPLFHRSALS